MKILLISLLFILAPLLNAQTYYLCQEVNNFPIGTPVQPLGRGLFKFNSIIFKLNPQQVTTNQNLAKFLMELEAQNRREAKE